MIPARTPASARLAVATLLVAVATLASMFGLRSLVLPPWTGTGVVGVALVTLTLVITRGLIGGRRARVAAAARAGVPVRRIPADDGGASSMWPTLAGLVWALWFLLAEFGGERAGFHLFVGPSAVGRVWGLLGDAGTVIRSDVAPVEPVPAVVLLCVGGTLLVLLCADVLASTARRPLLAAAVVLVLWLPTLTLRGEMPWGTFVVTVVAVLLSLSIDAPPGARRALRDPAVRQAVHAAERRRALLTTSTAAGVTVVALAASAAAGGLPAVSSAWSELFTTPVETTRISDNLDMNRSLQARTGDVMFTYTTTSGENVGPLRTMTLTDFDGRRWHGSGDHGGHDFGAGDLLFPDDVQVGAPTDEIRVKVGEMRDVRLPVPIEPRRPLDDLRGWRYDDVLDSIIGGRATRKGDTFGFSVSARALSADTLRAAPRGADAVGARYLHVTPTRHSDDIHALAVQVVGDAATDYDKAVAIQDYLRDTRNFTYSYDIPPGDTGDSVWDFMQSRQGYCVQFATAMVTFARMLGIPARLAVGYLPGTRTDDGSWRVTDEQAHAWPEIFFPGSGWVRFEPTPAVQTGAVPQYADPSAEQPAPAAPATPAATPQDEQQHDDAAAPPVASPSPELPRTEGYTPQDQQWQLRRWLIVFGALLVLGAVGTVVWRRRTAVRPPEDPEEAWHRVVASLHTAGVTLPTATTPRRAPEEAAQAWRSHTGEPMPDDVRAAIDALTGALEEQRYAPGYEPLEPAELDRLTRTVTAGISSGLSTTTSA